MSNLLPRDVDFRIPMQGKYVSFVRRAVRSFADNGGFSERECQDLEVAVGEAVTNAVLYGHPENGGGAVNIHCRLNSRRLVVDVEDESRSTCVPEARDRPDAEDEHGRGWILMRSLMDNVSIRCTSRGLLVRMIKRRNSGNTVALYALAVVL